MKSISIHAGGLQWSVEEWGAPGSRPLLLLHGFTGAARSWHRVAERLPHFHLVIPDLPGHGGTEPPSPWKAWSLGRLADALASLLDSLSHPRIAVVGYSMGGRIALHLALQSPERVEALGMIGASPGLPTAEERRERSMSDERIARRLEAEGIERFVAFWEEMPIFASQRRLSPKRLGEIRTLRLSHEPVALAAALRAFGTGVQESLLNRLGELTMPVHLIAGEEDTKYRSVHEKMAEVIQTGSVHLIPGSGHAVPSERPHELAALLSRCLGQGMRKTVPERGEPKR